jgi:hypothetical protein
MVSYRCETWSLPLRGEHKLGFIREQVDEKNIYTENGCNVDLKKLLN